MGDVSVVDEPSARKRGDDTEATHDEATEEGCTEEFEGYDLDEFKVVIHGILYDIFDQKRPLLRQLIKAKATIDEPPAKPKAGLRRSKIVELTGEALLKQVVDELFTIDQELSNVDAEILREQLFAIADNPPPVPPSPFLSVIMKDGQNDIRFEHHDIQAVIFSYLDVRNLLKLSQVSQVCKEAVDIYIMKSAYRLPLHSGSLCSNMQYWRQIIEFFFTEMVILKPISRSNYNPIQSQLRLNKTIFPINDESMKSHTYVSFDFIKPHYIVYCDHMKPMSHTCSADKAIDCDNKATSKPITLNEFIVEYCKRLEVKDTSSSTWGVPSTMVTPAYVCMLLKMTLQTIAKCINKHEGLVEYRRTEYIANATHHITHRIWLQLSLQWDFRFGQNAQNSLYLNIADHFTWDG
ncbi:hypothetical protein BgAZ_109550 [Babesia gibsoni]|uniref:F-box domain-containing protein n=1 Tax=Babesia gibsoni TaxID=33632 RepID=A0AAD8UWL9_BABGI|nr:hypothetical protein BgAZ_109550 [Babesia gibsoni]